MPSASPAVVQSVNPPTVSPVTLTEFTSEQSRSNTTAIAIGVAVPFAVLAVVALAAGLFIVRKRGRGADGTDGFDRTGKAEVPPREVGPAANQTSFIPFADETSVEETESFQPRAANRIAKLMREGQSISYKDQVREAQPRRSSSAEVEPRNLTGRRITSPERQNGEWIHRPPMPETHSVSAHLVGPSQTADATTSMAASGPSRSDPDAAYVHSRSVLRPFDPP